MIIPQNANQLPLPIGAVTTGIATSSVLGRLLQVGTYYAVKVPPTATVTSYVTNKTLSADLVVLTQVIPFNSSFELTVPCGADYQRVETAADGTQYCDSTPSPAQLTQLTGATLPRNMVDMAIPSTVAGVGAKLVVAAFDDASDPADANLNLSGRCSPNLAHGAAAAALLPQFYHVTSTVTVNWCEAADEGGGWWWVAYVDAPLGAAGLTGPHLKVLYTANTALGIVTAAQLLEDLQQRLATVLQPIAPVLP